MISKQQINMIDYIVICINDFAERFDMAAKSAFTYLSQYGGIDFLVEHYEAEHTLSLDEAIDDLQAICLKNGGSI